ncbi:ECF-type sigma factor [Ahniella affigens]|nr:ECF-type sigma factor [Ahniella affigens]
MNDLPSFDTDTLDLQALLPQVYEDLKQLAHRQLARMRPGDTFSTTMLVHETYERLAPHQGKGIASREHLMAWCARAMRQILIDHARSRQAQKRGSGESHLDLDDLDVRGGVDPTALLAINEALEQLEANDPRLVRLVELRVFAGLDPAEIAAVLGVNVRTIQRDWLRAKAWIGSALQ